MNSEDDKYIFNLNDNEEEEITRIQNQLIQVIKS